MKSLNEFKSFEIPEYFMKFLKGGSCLDLDNCVDTTIANDQVWLMDECHRVLGDTCDR